MAVKTKRSSVRTALLASASLAALAQGANAAINFVAGGGANDAFAAGVTPACSELYFLKSDGALVTYQTFNAGTASDYEKGRAVAITPGTETTFADCRTAPGYYLHTVATGDADGTGLIIEEAPAGWFAQGGQRLTDGLVKDTDAASLSSPSDKTDNVIDSCPAGSYSAAGSTSCQVCPEGTASASGDAFCGYLRVGYFGDTTDGTSAHATATICPAGTTRWYTATTGTGLKCTDIAANYYGTLGGDETVHATAIACPAGTTSTSKEYTAGNAGKKFYCDGIDEGYYGIAGEAAVDGYHADVTACPEGSTSDGTTAGGTASAWITINDCVTKPGYYLSTAGLSNHIAGTITQVPAGFYATGDVAIDASGVFVWSADTSTVQPGDYDSSAGVGRCPANSNSEAGATFCVCDAGYAPMYATSLSGIIGGTITDVLGGGDGIVDNFSGTSTVGGTIVLAGCAPISGYVASPTAATPAADSAGASTPIAVALAAAAAVPLLL